jgi:hypothetical protein
MPAPAIMQVVIPFLSGYGRIGRRTVSLPRIDDLLNDPASRYVVPRDADAPHVRPPAGARLNLSRGPSYRTMLKDWRATGTRDAFRARLERRLRKAGLIKPRHDDDDAFDRLLDAGSIDSPIA